MAEQKLSIEGQLIHQVFEFTHIFISEAEAKQLIETIKQAGYVQLAEDQGLPQYPLECHPDYFIMHAHLAQQDMLKANFRKVEL